LIGSNPVINGKQYTLKLSDGRASFASLHSIENPVIETEIGEPCVNIQLGEGPSETQSSLNENLTKPSDQEKVVDEQLTS
jgi:hypothetical protein